MPGSLRNDWQNRFIGLDATHHPMIQRLADAAQAFSAAFFRQQREQTMFVLSGSPGCGKSHTARNLYRWARGHANSAWEHRYWPRPPAVLFCSWPSIADSFKEGFYGVVDDMIDADLLVLDDVGAEHDPSKNAADKLCQVLSCRERSFTVVTTNIAPADWQTRFDERIADRFFRRSKVIDLTDVPSYAVAQRQKV